MSRRTKSGNTLTARLCITVGLATALVALLLAVACGGSAAPIPTPPSTLTPGQAEVEELRKRLGLPPLETTAVPTVTPTAAAATPLGLKDRVRQAAEVAATVAFLEDEFTRFYRAQPQSYEATRLYLAPSAVYGFLMAPFFRPELSAQEIDRLTMAQFLQGLGNIPTPEQINEALLRAGSAEPRTLTKAQAELAQVLRRPESNELVFQIATAPWVAQRAGQLREQFGHYLQGEFGKFQSQNPRGSLLEAAAAGLAGFTLPLFPGWK